MCSANCIPNSDSNRCFKYGGIASVASRNPCFISVQLNPLTPISSLLFVNMQPPNAPVQPNEIVTLEHRVTLTAIDVRGSKRGDQPDCKSNGCPKMLLPIAFTHSRQAPPIWLLRTATSLPSGVLKSCLTQSATSSFVQIDKDGMLKSGRLSGSSP